MVVFVLGIPNTRRLEVLPMSVHCSPAALKERVGTARTHLRPIQKDLDMSPIEHDDDDVREVYCVSQ